ncbi:MAG: hypothetical protein ABJM29_10975 [Rhizobiaceae bacterium]
MRAALIATFLLTLLAPAQAGNFNLYPGFYDRDTFVEMTSDKGLIIEIVLRCERQGNRVKAGIMTYSKVEGLFCSSKMLCTSDAEKAADDTCGY